MARAAVVFACVAAAPRPLPAPIDRMVTPSLDDAIYGDMHGVVPGVAYGNGGEPHASEAEMHRLNDECQRQFAETAVPFATAKRLATANYYETTSDFQGFRNHDLLPENEDQYSWGNRLRRGVPLTAGDPNEDVTIAFGTCEVEDVDGGGTWASERVGPFYSSGGYDWWQLGWADALALTDKLKGGGVYIEANSIVVTDGAGAVLGYPPIHVHHVHLAFAPGVRPRLGEYYCGLGASKPCYNASWFFEWRVPASGGARASGRRPSPAGTATTSAGATAAASRACTRPGPWAPPSSRASPSTSRARSTTSARAGRRRFEWYFQTGIRWRHGRDFADAPQVLSSFITGVPGRTDRNNQQTFVRTFPAPIDYDSMAWSNVKIPFNGRLVRNKVHSHMTAFYKLLWVAGDVTRVLDGRYAPSSVFQAWRGAGKGRGARAWEFRVGDDAFTLGWNVRKRFPLTLDETADFDGVIVSRTVPQHFGQMLTYVDRDRGSRATCVITWRRLDAPALSWAAFARKLPAGPTCEEGFSEFFHQLISWTIYERPDMPDALVRAAGVALALVYFGGPAVCVAVPAWLAARRLKRD
ncbi:hypothetical protein JL721_3216 [Aureococcus anophagefferens]|nr:hypothetical protein JL721_3216 [Aureococcus anophagefferens]